jgi:hypothetical protein
MSKLKSALDEVARRLSIHADAAVAATSRADKSSRLNFLGLRVPSIRSECKSGFSFLTGDPASDVVAWDYIWRESFCFEVMCAPLATFDRRRASLTRAEWQVLSGWVYLVENWAHADWLGNVISYAAAKHHADVLPTLNEWAGSGQTWITRIGLVSHIHYAGKNAVFLDSNIVLDAVEASLRVESIQVRRARVWVLRTLAQKYETEVRGYVRARMSHFTSVEVSRVFS